MSPTEGPGIDGADLGGARREHAPRARVPRRPVRPLDGPTSERRCGVGGRVPPSPAELGPSPRGGENIRIILCPLRGVPRTEVEDRVRIRIRNWALGALSE